jgi:hypothetical protein
VVRPHVHGIFRQQDAHRSAHFTAKTTSPPDAGLFRGAVTRGSSRALFQGLSRFLL